MKRKLSEQESASDAVQFEDASDADEVEVTGQDKHVGRIKCPYLDTVNRQAIDFDSEKLCSVTLTNMNVYVCLVCGKYFQGRGKLTPAYTHSVQAGHFVFMNLQSGRAYCLPDNYEVVDSSLEDVQRCLSPAYTMKSVAELNANTSLARDVHGVSYLPGFVGLNNLNCTDYLNSLLHALSHVAPFRDYWLQTGHYEMVKSNIVQQFGLTLRKMWSGSNFKSTVSPQELVQELSVESKRRFSMGQRAECLELLVWLLGTLQKGLGKAAQAPAAAVRRSSDAPSVIYEPFQGVIEVTSLTKRLVSSAQELHLSGGDDKQARQAGQVLRESEEGEWVRTVTQVPFSYLSLDIPACPLFRDSEGGLVIPQVPLFELLKKFDGSSWTDTMTSEAHVRRQYRILQLPRYLILHLVRFTRNNFYLEKNPTIVTFPVKNLEMRDFLQDPAPVNEDAEGGGEGGGSMDVQGAEGGASKTPKLTMAERRRRDEERSLQSCPSLEQLPSLSASALKQLAERLGSDLHRLQLQTIAESGATGQAQHEQLLLLARSVVERVQLFAATKYDLVANICHGADSTSSSTKGGVTVGDLNMLLGQSAPQRGKGKSNSSSAGSGVVAGSGSSSSVNSGAVGDPRAGSAYTAASTVASNNRVLNEGMYKVHIQHKATAQWFEIQDLHVTEVTPQLIGVSESNILIYEKKPVGMSR